MIPNLYPGVMGMYEMEVALSRIYILDKLGRTTFSAIDFYDSGDKSNHALDGFAELVYRRWLKLIPPYNGCFTIGKELAERINQHRPKEATISSDLYSHLTEGDYHGPQ